MYRTQTCGELRITDAQKEVTLAGWVQTIRKFGSITFIDLRDRYGITQLLFNEKLTEKLDKNPLGREFVIQVKGSVSKRSNKNKNIPTGDVEILVSEFKVLNKSAVPPFTIQDETDGGDDLRMKYRYLDLRRNAVKKNIELRYAVNRATRDYLHENGFIDIETPFLIKSTPEGARDFVVPSRMNAGEFYALPQSPQTFKQLLMVSGYDRYYQIVKCFRDEDLRADRQPEFTQIDCEMSFVEQEDILQTFEGLIKFIFKEVKNIEYSEKVERMSWEDAMWNYGNDKPDIRFEMKVANLKVEGKNHFEELNNTEFPVFNNAETVVAISVPGCSDYSRKQTDELTDWVKRPQIGMGGLAFIKYNIDGTLKSSFDKFFNAEQLKSFAEFSKANPGDLILILAGREERTRKAISDLRLYMADRLHLRIFKYGLNVVDRTHLSKNSKRIYSMRIDANKYKNIDKSNIELIARQCSLADPHSLQIIEVEHEEVKPPMIGYNLSENMKVYNKIALYNSAGKPRRGHHYFIFIEKEQFAFSILNCIRTKLGTTFNLSDKSDFKLLWVTDFPLFEYDEEGNRWVARHHPFTSPKPEDIQVMIDNNPLIENAEKYLEHPYSKIKANAYDMVLNGNEIGGGSIRIFQRDLQEKMFAALGMSKEEAQQKFGFLMGAFEYGAPPHGGIAFGFDRLCAILGGSESIRDFIAFPKNNSGRDVMIDAPSTIDEKQLDELQIRLDLK